MRSLGKIYVNPFAFDSRESIMLFIENVVRVRFLLWTRYSFLRDTERYREGKKAMNIALNRFNLRVCIK